MWIKEPAKINDQLHYLGIWDSCFYLLKGAEHMLIGGGMSMAVPELEKQFTDIGIDEDKLKYIAILHSHFDHCGAVPYLKRRFPRIQVIASEYSSQVLVKDKVISSIAGANMAMIKRMGLEADYANMNLEFGEIKVDRIVKDGDAIDLGSGITVQVIEVPGHTKCSIALYVPAIKALFPTDSIPHPNEGSKGIPAKPSPQYSFTEYKRSLKKMTKYDVDILAFEHHGVLMHEQARQAIKEVVDSTEKYGKEIVNMYHESGDIDRVIKECTRFWQETAKLSFLDDETLGNVCDREIKSVLRDAGLVD